MQPHRDPRGQGNSLELPVQRAKITDVLLAFHKPYGVLSQFTPEPGARWRTMNVPGEDEYRNKGVAFCPHCDGPFYKGRDVAVVGGGNSGVEAAIDLAGICKHVTLVEFQDELRADADGGLWRCPSDVRRGVSSAPARDHRG